MIDRKKVIKALEVCSSIPYGEECPKECPYRGQDMYCIGSAGLMLDALDLLKEQESVIEALKSDLDETLAVLGEQPDIVRCRDCKYWRTNTEFCMCWSVANAAHHTNPNWFCGNGERR